MNAHEHLFQLLTSFEAAFLVTNGIQGPHARPLSIAAVDGTTVVWFLTSSGSEKAREIAFDPSVVVTFHVATPSPGRHEELHPIAGRPPTS